MQIIKILFFLFLPFLGFSQLPYHISLIKGQDTDISKLNDGNTLTGWFPGWNQGDYPVQALIEFDDYYYIEKIRYFDWVGKPKFTVYLDNDVLLKRTLNEYGIWQEREISTNKKTQSLIIEINEIQGDRPLTELEFYGNKDQVNPVTSIIKKFYGDANKIGVNGFHWIPQELNPTPNLRMYQMLQWTWTSDGIAVEPTFQADGNYDTYLQEAKKNNKEIVFCLNKNPDWFSNKAQNEWPDSRLHLYGKNPDDPNSYKEISQYVWQIAARYGSKTYPSIQLKVNQNLRWNGDVPNQKKSGLNLINYIEIENEPDRPWKTPEFKYTPEQYAALLSAIYDGHEGRLGSNTGIKAADKNLKVVMAGLSSINLNYLERMKIWFNENRTDQKFCADAIQVHHYCNSSNSPDSPDINLWDGSGISPEDDNLEYKLQEYVKFVNEFISKKVEIWFGEFGYDTNDPSTVLVQYPKIYGNHTAEELQGQWILRTYLYCLKVGIDKSYMFNLCDENSSNMGYVFGSSGLLTSQVDGYKKKQSWRDVDWLVRELNGWKFYKDVSPNENIKVFEFRNKIWVKYIYWSPTSNDSIYKFSIGKKVITATEKVQSIKLNRALDWTGVKEIYQDNNKN